MLSTTFSSWWLFLGNNFLWSMTVLKHSYKLMSYVVDKKSGRSLNLIDTFVLMKSKNESILFCCRQVFHNFSLTTLVIQSKISCWRQNIIDEKKSLTAFCLVCQQPYTKSQSPREIFIPVVSLMVGGMGPGDFWQLKEEKASIFQAADHCGWHVCRIILLTRPIIVLEVLVKTSVFWIHTVKCILILFNATKQ